MFAMFRQFFMMFTQLFSAGEKAANALNNMAEVGEKMSQIYLEEQRHALTQRVMQLEKQTRDVKSLTKAA